MSEQVQKIVPKLRFPEFNVSGKWTEYRLESFATFYKGKGVSKVDIDIKGKTPCIRYGELYTHYSEVINSVISRTNLPENELFLSKSNDVIIPASGETKWDIAKASCVMLDDVALGGDLNVIRTNQNGVFISYYLNGAKKYEISKIAQGDSVVHLYSSQLKLINLFLPPKPEEQQKIADCLSSLDDLITAQNQKVGALKQHKKGLMQQLFPAEGEPVPKLRFPEFENDGEWKEIKLIDTANKKNKWSFIGGPFGSNLKSSDYVTNGIRVIQLQNIGDAQFLNDYKIFTSEDKANELLSNNIYPGNIILSKMGDPVGRACLIPDTHDRYVMCSDGIRLAVDEEKFSKYFVYSLINSEEFRALVEKTATGSTRKRIGLDELKNLPMRLPRERDEQQKIAECLSSLDNLITTQTEYLKDLKNHKKGLMQKLFPSPVDISL